MTVLSNVDEVRALIAESLTGAHMAKSADEIQGEVAVNGVNRKVAGGVLQRLGHSVTLAKTGLEALEQVHQQTFDLILMDVQTPEMDGLEAREAFVRRRAGNPTCRSLP